MRWSRPEDLDALAEFNKWVFADPEGEPDEQAALQLREYMSPDHPTTSPNDHVLVEDTSTGKIVSSISLIPQTWSYGGIPFGVMRPELVGTDPAYRNRGLVRAQFETMHALSEQRGDLMQAITGIPYFYRQFGYEKTLVTSQNLYGVPLPAKQEDNPPYLVRPATESDLSTIVTCYQLAARRLLLAAVRDEAAWRWELTGRLRGSDYVHDLWIVHKPDGAPAGFFAKPEWFDSQRSILWTTLVEMLEGESWTLAVPIITEQLRHFSAGEAKKAGTDVAGVGFDWGAEHPFVQLQRQLFQASVRPFSWLIRIPDLVKFLKQITPVLNDRLAKSPFDHYNGELDITFYRAGLKLNFVDGKVAEIADFLPPSFREAGASFPDLIFHFLLFGCRTCEELEYSVPDCFVRKQMDRALLNVLFPKQPSAIWPL